MGRNYLLRFEILNYKEEKLIYSIFELHLVHKSNSNYTAVLGFFFKVRDFVFETINQNFTIYIAIRK
jgi:hypothetical protein